MAKVIGVKFRNTVKTYYFAPQNEKTKYENGSGVIVETSKGIEFGTVVIAEKEVDDKNLVHPLKPIL